MNVLRSGLLPPGTWFILYPGTAIAAGDLYDPAKEVLLRAGLSPGEAPPWLLEAIWAAGKQPGEEVSAAEAARLRRAGVPTFPLLDGRAVVDSGIGPGSRWTGPREEDWAPGGGLRLRAPVPAERWPFGPPGEHGEGCGLRGGGTFCDCCQSAAECDCHPRR